jgi:hypothetical protein
MHADVVVDDELQPGQAHAGIGQLAEVKGQLRVADVHHDFHTDLWHRATGNLGHFCLQQPVVNEARIAFGAADGHQRVLFQQLGGVAAAHHGRNAQLPGNDGRVARAPAAVGDDGTGALHDRLPVGIGHIGDQHIAGLHLVHFGQAVHPPHRPGTNLLPDRPPLGQHGAAPFELVAQLRLALRLALHGFRARLQDVELAVHAVLAPFDVHRASIVLLDDQGIASELLNIGIGQREAVALLRRDLDSLHQLAGLGLFLWRGEHHFDQLGTEVAPDQCALARTQHGFVHIELVRIHRPLHHRFAEAVAGRDEHHVLEAGFGVDGEHHTRSTPVGTHHALHASRQGDVGMGKTLVDAVADRPVVVQRGEDFLHLVKNIVDAMDVQEGFLLAGEGGVRQVLGRGRGAHGKSRLRIAGTQHGKGFTDRRLQGGRKRLRLDPGTDLRTGFGQGAHVLGVERIQTGVDAVRQAVVLQEFAKGVRRGGEPGGDLHTGGQLGNHFAEAGVLAADYLDIAHSQVLKRYDQVGRTEKCRHGKAPEVINRSRLRTPCKKAARLCCCSNRSAQRIKRVPG